MQIPIRINPSSEQSLQQQVFDAVRGLILDGNLKAGAPMPSSRALSEQLQVSRNTVILAYERLIVEGYLETRPSVGTFVNSDLPEQGLFATGSEEREAAVPDRLPLAGFRGARPAVVNPNRHKLAVDFWVGRPDPHTFPTKAWRRLMLHHLSTGGSQLTEYGDPAGLYSLRLAISEFLGPARGIQTDPERIVVVSGIQQALNIAARLLIRKDTNAVVECPCYQGAAYVFDSYGADLRPVPVDEDGLDTRQLHDIDARLAYVTPSHQYPMGTTLSIVRRIELLEWANNKGAYILEDDYDSDFRHNGSPLTALAGLDCYGAVIYMGTFSKSIGAALRLGYMVLPSHLVEPARTAKALLDNGHSWLDQAVLADFLTNGHYTNHLRRIRQMYRDRRDCLIDALVEYFGPVQLSGLEGGMHIVWHLPDDLPDAAECQSLAENAGVGVYSLDGGAATDCGVPGPRDRTLLLGYSSLTPSQIRDGVVRLSRALPAVSESRIASRASR